MSEIKKAPFQVRFKRDYPSHYITWEAHLKAYEPYAKRYGRSQSAELIAERGGFGDCELDELYPEWEKHIINN